jgi:hypothetical protein
MRIRALAETIRRAHSQYLLPGFYLALAIPRKIGGNMETRTRSAIDAEKYRIAGSQTVALLAQDDIKSRRSSTNTQLPTDDKTNAARPRPFFEARVGQSRLTQESHDRV